MNVQQAFDLALQHHRAGRLAEAEALYRQILAVQPNHADVTQYLGVIAHQAGRDDLAVEWIGRAIALNPNSAGAHCNLGEAWRGLGRFADALASYRRAVELQPDFAEAHNNVGVAAAALGDATEAISAYRRALVFKPDYAACHSNLGVALAMHGHSDDAIAEFHSALALRSDDADTENNLAVALMEQGRIEEALAAYRRAHAIAPGDAGLLSGVIFTLLFHTTPGESILREQERWNRLFSDPLARIASPHTNDPNPQRRLRVGYVSPDLRDHVVGRNLQPLFANHDRDAFEIFAYASVVRPDFLTEAIRQRVDHWRSTVGVSNETLAGMIRQDGIDILVDLSQHAGGNRLPLFARRPAPVQVSFASYPESTGLDGIHYRISDVWLEGKRDCRAAILAAGSFQGGEDRRPTMPPPIERVFLLDSFWCYDPLGVALEVNALPAATSGTVTFGCLHSFCKINEPVLQLWARLLGEVEDARLILLAATGSHRQRTLDFLERHGVRSGRVEFVEPRARESYLALYHRLDLVLDTFPYGGHTTSLDALWMGVPVISLAGERAISRAVWSQLSNLGLPELVAHSEEEYVRIATALARDLPRLADLRRALRPRLQGSVLMDGRRFAGDIEAAYRAMWQQWCNKE